MGTQARNVQSASAVLMIRPASFGFNEITAASNVFQNKMDDLLPAEIQRRALVEFDAVASALKKNGITVEVIDDTLTPAKPDAVFPNNWIALQPDGTIVLFPMQAPNRRSERRRDIVEHLQKKFHVTRVLDFSASETRGKFLEGTGSIVFDHLNTIAYAILSPRTDAQLLERCATDLGYTSFAFHAVDRKGTPIYHTNVVMCVGTEFAVIALASIPDAAERARVKRTLQQSGRTIVEITETQVEHFAGNMLELTNAQGERIIVMSEQARQSLTSPQVSTLERFAHIVAIPIPTIETVGGGSVRCMLAEIFCQRM
ncbi:MAG: amidinotransferase [Deltaproteobacteria bacterium]|nr:amidinotransferase [Deltaproteobacteria bacterium]